LQAPLKQHITKKTIVFGWGLGPSGSGSSTIMATYIMAGQGASIEAALYS
jgi:hypothetical protein